MISVLLHQGNIAKLFFLHFSSFFFIFVWIALIHSCYPLLMSKRRSLALFSGTFVIPTLFFDEIQFGQKQTVDNVRKTL